MEQWRSIPEFNNRYLISDSGRIIKNQETITVKTRRSKSGIEVRHLPEKRLIPERTTRGLRIALRNDGERHYFYIDCLVLGCFVGYKPDCIAHHIDGDLLNNHISNLEWKHQQYMIPVKTPDLIKTRQSKFKKVLTEIEAKKAFTDMRDNATVAKEIGISPLAVELIKQRIIWTKYTDGITRDKRPNIAPISLFKYPHLVNITEG